MKEAIWYLVGVVVFGEQMAGLEEGRALSSRPFTNHTVLPRGARDSPFNRNQWELLRKRKGWMGGGARDLFLCCSTMCHGAPVRARAHKHTHTRTHTDNRKALQLNNRPPVKLFFNPTRTRVHARSRTHKGGSEEGGVSTFCCFLKTQLEKLSA